MENWFTVPTFSVDDKGVVQTTVLKWKFDWNAHDDANVFRVILSKVQIGHLLIELCVCVRCPKIKVDIKSFSAGVASVYTAIGEMILEDTHGFFKNEDDQQSATNGFFTIECNTPQELIYASAGILASSRPWMMQALMTDENQNFLINRHEQTYIIGACKSENSLKEANICIGDDSICFDVANCILANSIIRGKIDSGVIDVKFVCMMQETCERIKAMGFAADLSLEALVDNEEQCKNKSSQSSCLFLEWIYGCKDMKMVVQTTLADRKGRILAEVCQDGEAGQIVHGPLVRICEEKTGCDIVLVFNNNFAFEKESITSVRTSLELVEWLVLFSGPLLAGHCFGFCKDAVPNTLPAGRYTIFFDNVVNASNFSAGCYYAQVDALFCFYRSRGFNGNNESACGQEKLLINCQACDDTTIIGEFSLPNEAYRHVAKVAAEALTKGIRAVIGVPLVKLDEIRAEWGEYEYDALNPMILFVTNINDMRTAICESQEKVLKDSLVNEVEIDMDDDGTQSSTSRYEVASIKSTDMTKVAVE